VLDNQIREAYNETNVLNICLKKWDFAISKKAVEDPPPSLHAFPHGKKIVFSNFLKENFYISGKSN
jgi:hypothetical protein